MARQMKDSGVDWIREIPEGWDILPAKRMFCNSGETKKADDVQLTASQQYGIISQSDYMALTGSRVVLATQDLEKWKHVEPQDFIISLRSFQGGLEMSKVSGCITWHYVVLRSCHKGINARFYKWLFKSSEYITALQRTCNYIRDGQDLRYSNFEQVPLFLPKEEEQEIIANILDTKCAEIDKVVEQTRATIEEYKKLKQAIITEAVTKGVRGPRPMKPSCVEWIGDIPEEWSKDKICRVCNLIGSGTTPKFDRFDLSLAEVPWIQSGDLSTALLHHVKTYVTPAVIAEYSALKVYKAPFIVVAMYGASIGNTSISAIDACVNQACCVLVSRTFNIRYLYYIIIACKPYFIYQGEGGGQPNISQEKIRQTRIPVPLIPEQQEIATYLDTKCAEIDRIIKKKEQLIEELGSYKKSLIYEYVTGKKEVTA